MGLQHVHEPHVRTPIPEDFPEHPVEGAPPSEAVQRVESRILVIGSVVAFAAASAIGYLIGGPRGVGLGLTVFAAYFLLGWWPYFAARHYRHRTHED